MANPTVIRPAKPAWVGREAPLAAGLILGSVLLAYLPALRGGMLWDDDAHVTRPALRSLRGLLRIWAEPGATQQYYPVLHSAFWIEHRIWGDAVLGYHLANAAEHAAAAWLLVAALRRLEFPAALPAGLLFALHPVCVESVAWISEQKNTLSAVFYLGSALAYLRFDEARTRGGYVLALGLFAAAVLTKSVTATLPAALLVVLWWRRGRLSWVRDVLPLAPWLAVGAAAGLFTAWAERTLIGAEGAAFDLSVLQRVLLSGRAAAFYAGKLLWPDPLLFIYPRWSIDTGQWTGYLYPAGVLGVLAVLAAGRRRARGPLAGALFFLGTLFPALGFLNVYPFLFSYVADHFQYLASLGILVPAAWLLARAASALAPSEAARACLMSALPAVLGLLSYSQCRDYADADTLYRATLERNPSAWLAHYNLGVSLGSQPGRRSEAIAEYEAALRVNPDHWPAHLNLGTAYMSVPGRMADAVTQLRWALRLNPASAEAHNNLGLALGHLPGWAAEAESELREALRLRPDYADARLNLGELLLRLGRPDAAQVQLQAAVRGSPGNPEFHFALANALVRMRGTQEDAVREYREAIRLRPGYLEAHANLGAALGRLPGRIEEALSELREAARLAPGDPRVQVNLAHALARAPGRTADALAAYAAALRLAPADAEVHNDLGVLLSDTPGRLEDAVAEFRAAVRLDPSFAQAHFCLGVGLLRSGAPRSECAAEFRRALELRPDFDQARRALEAVGGKAPP